MRTTRTRLLILLVALLVGLGPRAHLAVLQTLAWSGMLVSYSWQDGLVDGVSNTFSGKAPCPLCKIVKQASNQDSERLAPSSAVPDPASLPPSDLALTPVQAPIVFAPVRIPFRDLLFPEPPSPPPRAAV